MNIDDPDTYRTLGEIMREFDLAEIKIVKPDHTLRLRRRPKQNNAVVEQSLPTEQPANDLSEPAAVNPANALIAPVPGRVYLAPDPKSPHFVQPGDTVALGQTIVLVLAMKVSNPIPAHKAGVVKSILVENEGVVEYGDILAIIE